jgi:hypothetical protein
VCLTVRLDLAAAAEPAVRTQLAEQLRHAGAEAVVLVLVGEQLGTPDPAPPDQRRGATDTSRPAEVAAPSDAPRPADAPCPTDTPGQAHRSGRILPPRPAGTPAAAAPPLPHRRRADEVARQCRVGGLTVLDALWVDRGRWWSYRCASPACCPPGGRPVDPAAAGHLAAELAVCGRQVLPDRESLERSVAPDLPLGAEVAAQVVARAFTDFAALAAEQPRGRIQAGAELFRAAVERCTPGRPGLDGDERGRLTALLYFPWAWDGVLRWIDGPRHEAVQALLLELTRGSPPPWGATPAALLALYAYARGDGALARVCADRALADDPGHELGTVVHRMLDGGIAPEQVVAAIRKGVRRCSPLSSP